MKIFPRCKRGTVSERVASNSYILLFITAIAVATPTAAQSPNVTTLICTGTQKVVRFNGISGNEEISERQIEDVLEINFSAKTVDGQPAKIDENMITWEAGKFFEHPSSSAKINRSTGSYSGRWLGSESARGSYTDFYLEGGLCQPAQKKF